MTPLNESSEDATYTTQNKHKRRTSIPSAGLPLRSSNQAAADIRTHGHRNRPTFLFYLSTVTVYAEFFKYDIRINFVATFVTIDLPTVARI